MARFIPRPADTRAPLDARAPARPSEVQCPPACPDCGGLECLCRPRFFAGQVLTETDLNRLENYVIAKNKLHNRHLHGPGVVCGLEVVCDPCDASSVIVKPGYAIAPCGEDIVVCNDAKAAICELIQRCRPRDNDCDPYRAPAPSECKDGTRLWLLSICYDERPARGVTPLMSEPCACGSGGGGGCGNGSGSCGCGGAGAACGCGTKANTGSAAVAKSMSRAQTKYNPQCEPTLVCEGYRFTATKYVPPERLQADDPGKYGIYGVLAARARQFGPLLTRLLACYTKAEELRAAFASIKPQASATDIALSYAEYRDALREFAEQHVRHRCDLLQALYRVAPPRAVNRFDAVAAPAAAEWQASFDQLNVLWLEVFRECFCSALLPPCPEPEPGNCVPLAVVTVDATTCRVIEICNWVGREFALTLPALHYWTSFLNFGAIKDVIARLCWGSSREPWALIFRLFGAVLQNNVASPLRLGATARAAPSAGVPPVSTPVTVDRAEQYGGAIPFAVLQALGSALEEVTKPDGIARVLSVVQPPLVRASKEVEELHAAVSSLQATVREQGEAIARLRGQDG